MPTIHFELDPSLFGSLRLSPDEFAREMRIAAAVQWYSEGRVSQEKASELAGLSRMEFLEELRNRKVSACQASLEELREEIHG